MVVGSGNPSVPAVKIPIMSDPAAGADAGDFSVAATSLVDLSHLQETVVWLVNQLHRHQDEISILQNRRDVDIPTLKAQLYKQRTWMVEKKYQYRVEKSLAFGFSVFATLREEARKERAKWRMANARAYKTAANKAMRNWEAFWREEKVYRHHVKFSLRNIRRNRLCAMFGIWQYDWMIGKRDRAIIAARDAREARRHKINGLTGFFNQWARKLRHRALINRMTSRRHDNTKAQIVTAWKFVIDFEKALEHKLNWFTYKHDRAYKYDAIARWLATVERSRSQKGLVFRTHRYHRNRRLAAAMEDWSSAARLQHKLRLLELCERDSSDPLDLAQAMEHVVEGIVMRQHVRAHELQVAHALRGRIADLKLQASVSMLESTIAKKVDKPTAEMIQRRGLRSWESVSLAQGTQKTTPAPAAPAAPSPAPAASAPAPAAEAPAAEPAGADPDAIPVAGTGVGLPHSSHRMLLEQQYREHAARHMAAHAPLNLHDRQMRQAAFDAAHGPHPPHPADAAAHHEHMMHVQANEMAMRDAGILGGVPPPPEAPAGAPAAETSAMQHAREQVNSLRNTLNTEKRQ